MKNIKIIILEDDYISSQDLKNILLAEGYEVIATYQTGESLLNEIVNLNPDIAILDIKLDGGGIDGIETARMMKKIVDIPIIYLTSYSESAMITKLKDTEPSGYILKPFDRREIDTNIEIAVHMHKIKRETRQTNEWHKSIITGIGDAVIVTDKRGNIKFENEQSRYLTGFDMDEILGKNINQFFQLEQYNENYNDMSNDVILVRKDGNKIPIYENAKPIKNSSGEITGIVMTFHKR